jgi:hypothetical protein
LDLAGLTQVDLDPVASGVQKVPGGAEGLRLPLDRQERIERGADDDVPRDESSDAAG